MGKHIEILLLHSSLINVMSFVSQGLSRVSNMRKDVRSSVTEFTIRIRADLKVIFKAVIFESILHQKFRSITYNCCCSRNCICEGKTQGQTQN